jgi:hypothetical protein
MKQNETNYSGICDFTVCDPVGLRFTTGLLCACENSDGKSPDNNWLFTD